MHDKYVKKQVSDVECPKMHFEDICVYLSPKSSLTRNPEEEKTQGQKVNQNNNLSLNY